MFNLLDVRLLQLEEYELDCFGQVDDAPSRSARIIQF
jgi:hypothetical protein